MQVAPLPAERTSAPATTDAVPTSSSAAPDTATTDPAAMTGTALTVATPVATDATAWLVAAALCPADCAECCALGLAQAAISTTPANPAEFLNIDIATLHL
jgi:hypothetical protein